MKDALLNHLYAFAMAIPHIEGLTPEDEEIRKEVLEDIEQIIDNLNV